MQIHITPYDGVPIYRQIINQIKFLVAAKRLSPGDELPPIRQLAQQLVINPNTVARAYRELETIGLLSSRQGSGTTVADNGSPLSHEEKFKILGERADTLLSESRQLGVEYDEVLGLLEERNQKLTGNE